MWNASCWRALRNILNRKTWRGDYEGKAGRVWWCREGGGAHVFCTVQGEWKQGMCHFVQNMQRIAAQFTVVTAVHTCCWFPRVEPKSPPELCGGCEFVAGAAADVPKRLGFGCWPLLLLLLLLVFKLAPNSEFCCGCCGCCCCCCALFCWPRFPNKDMV